MATPGQLVETIAEVLGKPTTTIIQHDRVLAGSGLRIMKGRGRGAAHVTARDAAHVLIAVLGSDVVVESATIVHKYARAKLALDTSQDCWTNFCVPEMSRLPEGHSFVDALEALIQSFQTGVYPKLWRAYNNFVENDIIIVEPSIRIQVQSPYTFATICSPTTEIDAFRFKAEYKIPSNEILRGFDFDPLDKILGYPDTEPRSKISDLIQWREITTATIAAVADRLNR